MQSSSPFGNFSGQLEEAKPQNLRAKSTDGRHIHGHALRLDGYWNAGGRRFRKDPFCGAQRPCLAVNATIMFAPEMRRSRTISEPIGFLPQQVRPSPRRLRLHEFIHCVLQRKAIKPVLCQSYESACVFSDTASFISRFHLRSLVRAASAAMPLPPALS